MIFGVATPSVAAGLQKSRFIEIKLLKFLIYWGCLFFT